MATSNRRLVLSAVVGVVLGGAMSAIAAWQIAVLLGWCAAAVGFLAFVARGVGGFDASATEEHATEEEPSVLVADATLLVAAVASLIGVGFILAKAGDSSGLTKGVSVGVGALSVMLAWTTVQTIYMLRYARMYYDGTQGGVDFGDDQPTYGDFAYLAFTIGMTYQVSDTAITDRGIRRVVLRHALLSFLFATAFIAVLVNVVGGLL
jgi:uncharacterized membrane protein